MMGVRKLLVFCTELLGACGTRLHGACEDTGQVFVIKHLHGCLFQQFCFMDFILQMHIYV